MKDKLIHLRIDAEIREGIDFLKDQDINISGFIRRALKEKIEQLREKNTDETK